ncbi:MAG: type II secretion system secretin GspD [Pseudomonadota bacterium]|nr:type II secretion system secretin GspD [Pseudomonadota bacterium]
MAATTVITPAVAQTSRAKPKPQPRAAQNPSEAAQTGTRDEGVLLNFVNADIDAVVRAIGQYTGRTFVIDPRVKGTLSLSTERPVTRQQAYDQLLTALRLQGFTIVQTGNVARVVPEADAKLQGGAVIIPKGSAPSGDQLVTQVFRLQYESATAMVPILRPLIAPNNTISAYPQNNTLVITDYADNLRRIQRIIESIDTPATSDVELIPVKNGLALEIATVVNRVIDEGARAAGQASDAGQRVSILAEPRTNSIIIRAPSPQRLQLAKSLIAQLDKPALTPGNINVIHLRNAEAVRLAPLLRAIIGADASFVAQGSGGSGLSPTTSLGPASGSAQPGLSAGTPGGTSPGIGQIASGGSSGGGGTGGLAGMIQADPATNSLIITAPEVLYRNIRAIVDKLDTRRAQVVIESLIVEVTADKAAEFGIQWQALSGLDGSNTSVIGGTNFGGTGTNIIQGAQNIASLGQGLNLGVVRGRVNIPGVGEVINLAFLARALATSADANILSTPTIQTLDNEEAKFLVGQNIPLITGSFAQGAGSGAGVNPFQTFERRDIGLQLRVKPQISEGGVVRLAIYQELSSIQNTLTAAQGGIITNKRSFESSVLVEDGNIVVLGGLIEDRTDNSKSQVPLLGDIPVVGGLFRYENRGRRKTNLLVFLRPYVVRDESTSNALALDRYDYIRGQVNSGTLPDNLIFRDLQGRQLPASPTVPPALRRPTDGPGSPATGAAAPGAEPAPLPRSPEAGLGARIERTDPPAPVIEVAPPAPPPTPAPIKPTSEAPVPTVAPPPIAVAPTRRSDPVAPPVATAAAQQPAPASPTERAQQPPAPIIDVPPPAPDPVPAPAPAPMAPAAPVVTPTPVTPAPVTPTPLPAPPATVVAPPASLPSAVIGGAAAPSAAPSSTARTDTSTTRPAVTQSGSSLLQVAAVTDIARGRDLQRQLRAAGMDAYWESVRTKQGNDEVRVRVTVDPATQSMADAIAKLKAMGFDPIIVTP